MPNNKTIRTNLSISSAAKSQVSNNLKNAKKEKKEKENIWIW